MFFAARTFLQKIGVTLGILVFASLTNLGNSPGDDLGIRLSGPACVVVILIAAFAFSFLNEKKLLSEIAACRGSIDGKVGVVYLKRPAESSCSSGGVAASSSTGNNVGSGTKSG